MFRNLIIVTILLTLTATVLAGPALAGEKRTLCVAHRGGSAYAPENTMAAFRNAIKMKADYFELDVHMSRDGHLVVIHDDELERTTDGTGQVKDKTLAQLKKLDAGSWFSPEFKGERVPTLEEALDLAKGKIGVVIEIKNGPNFYEGIEKKVVDLVKKKGMEKDVIIISFDHSNIKKAHKLDPKIAGGILFYANILNVNQTAENSGASLVCPGWQLLTPEMISDCHKNGLKLNIWTVNDPALMARFIREGVDVITTDKPDVLIEQIRINKK